MNTPTTPPPVGPPESSRWLWVALALILIPLVPLGGLALGVASYFHLSADTRALRDGLTQASGANWQKQIGINIGSLTLSAVRSGISFAQLDPKAQEALQAAQAIKGVEVGVYELTAESSPPDRATMLSVADKVMSARGWERVVGVLDGDDMVGVFLPVKMSSASRMKCCVVVLDGRQLVLVSGRADLEPLLEWVRNQPDWRDGMRSLASR